MHCTLINHTVTLNQIAYIYFVLPARCWRISLNQKSKGEDNSNMKGQHLRRQRSQETSRRRDIKSTPDSWAQKGWQEMTTSFHGWHSAEGGLCAWSNNTEFKPHSSDKLHREVHLDQVPFTRETTPHRPSSCCTHTVTCSLSSHPSMALSSLTTSAMSPLCNFLLTPNSLFYKGLETNIVTTSHWTRF